VSSTSDSLNWARQLVDEQGEQRIRAAVERVEARTSAEIVPLLVRDSICTGHVPWLLFFIFLFTSFLGLSFFNELLIEADIPDGVLEFAAFGVSAALAYFCRNSAFFKRRLTSRHDQLISVERRALLEFHLAHVEATENRTGILIMASALERRAVVLADRAINEKIPVDVWNDVVEILVSRTRNGQFAEGMVAAIEKLGEHLSENFSSETGSNQVARKNELDNGLVIKL
jgi:putative membrane protein